MQWKKVIHIKNKIMTQNENELLLKDLSARLSYGVKISIPDLWTQELEIEVLDEIFKGDDGIYRVNSKGQCIKYIKPYLFPISSLTNEQKNDFPFESSLLNAFINGYISLFEDEELTVDDIIRMMDWFNQKHIDYRGLIPMGLAIDATGLNIY